METRTKQILAVAVLLVLVLAASVLWAAGTVRTVDQLVTQVIEFSGAGAAVNRGDTGPYTVPVEAGLGFSGGAGKWPTVQAFPTVAAAAADSVHAAISIPTGATVYTDTTDSITNPDVYRTCSITGSASAALSAVTITGTLWDDTVATETIKGTGAATVVGACPFKTVTNIRVYGVATPAGATFSVGCSEKLGLAQPVALDADVVQIDTVASAGTAWVRTAAGALPTGAVVKAVPAYASGGSYTGETPAPSTVDPETAITAADGYLIYYNASKR